LIFFLAACGSLGHRGADMEQRSLQEKAQAEKKAQEELKRQQEEQARLKNAQSPVIQPITGGQVSGSQLQADSKPNMLGQRAIYYDFDRHDIKDEFIPMIEAHAKFLVVNPKFKVAVQGNCDSRGSREYNVALGQRRADNVKRALILLGVPEKQVRSTSFGAEKPVDVGQNEKSWSKNRRSDLVYF
jgi:peptidoglycan-associated lipoprotein